MSFCLTYIFLIILHDFYSVFENDATQAKRLEEEQGEWEKTWGFN